jgi:hypothetical protein
MHAATVVVQMLETRTRTMRSVPSVRCASAFGKKRSMPPESDPKNLWYAAGTLRYGQTG